MIVFLGLSEKWECALKKKHLNREKYDQPLEVGVPYFQTNSYVFSKSFIMVNGSE